MIAFITYIIKLIIKLIFVDEIAKENEELKKENQQLKQEKEEIAEGKAEVIQQHFSLFQKYLAIKQQKEQLIRKLDQYKSAQPAQPFNHCYSTVGLNHSKYTPKSNELDINQKFDLEDWDIIDQLFREFTSSEELTI